MALNSLKRKTFQGALSLGGATLVVRVVGMLGIVFLARLIDPGSFGIVALAYLVLNIVSLLAPLGLGGALVQHRGEVSKAAFQVFVVTCATGVIAFALVYLAKRPLAELLGDASVEAILPWTSSLILFEAIARVPDALMERELRFNRLGAIMIVTEMLYYVLAVALALQGYGAWSLVYATVGKAAVGCAMSWTLVGSWQWLRWQGWDSQLMRGLFRFGSRVVGGNIAYYFYLNADAFVVGRELGAVALGYYSKAFDFTKKTVDQINKVVGTVLFPSYAKMQDDIPRLANAYLKSLRLISCITIPMSMGVFVLARPLVQVIFGERWLDMVPILEVLAFMSLVKPISSTTSAVFGSVGRPQYNMYAAIVVSVALVAGIFFLLPYGAVGVAVSVVIAQVAGLLFNIYQLSTILQGRTLQTLRALQPALIATVSMMVVLSLAKPAVLSVAQFLPSVAGLSMLLLTGVIAYVSVLVLVEREVLEEVWQLVRGRA